MKKYLILMLVPFMFACGPSKQEQALQSKVDSLEAQSNLKEEALNSKFQLQETALLTELDSLLGPKEIRPIKIRIKKVTPSYFEHKIEVSGAVEAKNSAYISPETGGQIKAIRVKEGQRVKKGQLMISLNANPLRSQLGELKSGLKLAETIYEKQKELWDQKIGSEVQYLEAKNNKEALESKIKSVQAQIAMSEIRAPFSGIVDEIHQKVGELAAPGQPMLDFVSLSKIEISAEVSEKHLQAVDKGDKVAVEFPNFSSANTESTISRKGNIINPANRTFKIAVPIPNHKEKIKPNQIATLRLNDYTTDSALVVPSIIVRKDLNGDFLFVSRGDKAVKTYVSVGRAYNGESEITKGLKNGDQVIVEGYNLVRNGAPIEIAQ